MPALVIDTDTWLSEVMGRPVWKVATRSATSNTAGISDGLMGKDVIGKDAARSLEMPGFKYAKVPVAEVATIQALESRGFRFVDVAVDLQATNLPAAMDVQCGSLRPAIPSDASAVTELARSSFVWSRFHQDPLVPKKLADEIKSRWAGNFFHGLRGDHMVVAEDDGKIEGFLQLLSAKDGALVIDLVAVGARLRGRGVAGAMIIFAEKTWGQGMGMRVGTQLANSTSLGLYRRMGFSQVGANVVLHHHQPAGSN